VYNVNKYIISDMQDQRKFTFYRIFLLTFSEDVIWQTKKLYHGRGSHGTQEREVLSRIFRAKKSLYHISVADLESIPGGRFWKIKVCQKINTERK
jgi:hypothetical protein